MKWYTSDLHIGHNKIAEIRGYGSTEVHNRDIAVQWDKVVKPDDAVWILGDLSIGNPTKALEWVAARPGIKHLVTGNHDECHPSRTKAHIWQKKYLEVFASVQPFAVHKFNGERVALSHFPYEADRTEVREMQWRLPNMGMMLLHGHLHVKDVFTSNTEIHIGFDAWGELVREDTIQILLDNIGASTKMGITQIGG